MSKASVRFRIASYNTHKCRGIHGTISPDRVIRVIEELDMDVLCLQEIVDAPGGTGKFDQANRIAESLPKMHMAFGKTRPLYGGRYGNMLLSRFPIVDTWKDASRSKC
jgi:endonuclease/exonuclease/phosphatase family metal-dependent hydrolase